MSREFAPPVSAPPFFYSLTSGLYVEIDGNRHSRSGSDRLYRLLTYKDPGPVLTKAGKPKIHQPAPHKDEPGHFYVAQLLLYGLQHLKSKPAAKKALLRALQGDGGLTAPENILKIERDLAAEYGVKNAAAEKEYEKQKLLEKERKEKERKKRQRDEEDLLAQIQAPSDKKSKKSSKVSKCLDIRDISGAYKIAAPKVSNGWDCHGPLTLKFAPSSTTKHIWGSFDFGVFEGKLRSSSAITTSANKDDNKKKKDNSSIVTFTWRGRETGEGESTYGAENVAEIEFLGDGKFRGSMYWDCLGRFELVGKKDADASRNRVFAMYVPRWKSEFWAINDSSYERERVRRWGGSWLGRGEDEKEENSDTENENEEDGSEDEEHLGEDERGVRCTA